MTDFIVIGIVLIIVGTSVAYIVKEFLAKGGRDMTIEPHLKVFDGLKDLETPGDTSVVGQQYVYPNSDASFDAACNALKDILHSI